MADTGENSAAGDGAKVMGRVVNRVHGVLRAEDLGNHYTEIRAVRLDGKDNPQGPRSNPDLLEMYQEVKIVRIQPWRPTGPISGRTRRWLVALGVGGGLLVAGLAQAAWTAAMKPDPLTHQPSCLVSSDPQLTPDGYDATPVSLVFNGASLLVVTESELDSSFADLQLVIDKSPPIRSAQISRNKMILAFDQSLPDLVRQLRTGRQAVVYLRFWPTWPATESFAVPFSLAGFAKAHDAMSHHCQPPSGPGRPAS